MDLDIGLAAGVEGVKSAAIAARSSSKPSLDHAVGPF